MLIRKCNRLIQACKLESAVALKQRVRFNVFQAICNIYVKEVYFAFWERNWMNSNICKLHFSGKKLLFTVFFCYRQFYSTFLDGSGKTGKPEKLGLSKWTSIQASFQRLKRGKRKNYYQTISTLISKIIISGLTDIFSVSFSHCSMSSVSKT